MKIWLKQRRAALGSYISIVIWLYKGEVNSDRRKFIGGSFLRYLLYVVLPFVLLCLGAVLAILIWWGTVRIVNDLFGITGSVIQIAVTMTMILSWAKFKDDWSWG